MRQHLSSLAATVLGASVLVLLSGCAESKLAEVKGAVSFNGKPVEKGVISFFPEDATKGKPEGGKIIDGKYAVSAPIGKTKVTISMPVVAGQKKLYNTPDSPSQNFYREGLPGKFSGIEKSELRLDVPPGGVVKDWDLTGK